MRLDRHGVGNRHRELDALQRAGEGVEIPILIERIDGAAQKERNAASALLAVLAHVDEFGRTLLKPLGAPAGKIEAFVETPFKLDNGKSIRPWWEPALT